MSIYPSQDIEKEVATLSCGVSDSSSCDGASVSADRHNREFVLSCARIVSVAKESPADDAGFEAGCYLTSVNGSPLRDMIDWRWFSDGDEIEVGYIDLDQEEGVILLEREEGEDWGFEFEGVVFDGVKQCRNACTFCFMRQLPNEARPSLTLRDDDFRLSFLAGTFVTFTNLSAEDEARIIEQHISPLRFSLHASNPSVRRFMIGKHAAHGLAALDRLLEAGIEFHAQIVLVPDQNDGEALVETLSWAYERPGITDLCIVPLGFTKHQDRFTKSFNSPEAALTVMETVLPFQERALKERGSMWVFPADEFYHNAYPGSLFQHLPSSENYGDFAMFEDGVGIIRSFIDDWEKAEESGIIVLAEQVLRKHNLSVRMLVGYATKEFWGPLAQEAFTHERLLPLYVQNDYFGGNVDVTGLLCACDMVKAINDSSDGDLFLIPRVVFNDNGMTLDDQSFDDMEKQTSARMAVVSCNPSEFFREIITIANNELSN